MSSKEIPKGSTGDGTIINIIKRLSFSTILKNGSHNKKGDTELKKGRHNGGLKLRRPERNE